MIDNFSSLNKLIIKSNFFGKIIIYDEQGRMLFSVIKHFGRKQMTIYSLGRVTNFPLLIINWKVKGRLVSCIYRYNIAERSRRVIFYIESEGSPLSFFQFIIKDISQRNIGIVQPNKIDYKIDYMNIVINNKRVGIFYKNAHISPSYTLDLTGDKNNDLDRRLAISLASILAKQNLAMGKFSGKIDWEKPVATGDEIYKIKRG